MGDPWRLVGTRPTGGRLECGGATEADVIRARDRLAPVAPADVEWSIEGPSPSTPDRGKVPGTPSQEAPRHARPPRPQPPRR